MAKAFVAVLMLFAVYGSATYWFGRGATGELPPLKTAEITRGDIEYTIDATGTVEPEEVVDVGAQVAGKVAGLGTDPRHPERTIDYGSPVEVGTVLARIDDSLYQSEVEQARAQVESARALADSSVAQVAESEANVERANKDILQMQARLTQAERDWRRAENLWNTSRGALSEAEYDLARYTYQAAEAALGVGQATVTQAIAQVAFAKANVAKSRADLSQAEAAMRRAETNLGYCTIKSPVNGVIVDRRINIGQTVVSSLNSPSLFLLAKDLKRLEVWASVNEADIGNIRSGQQVRFTVDTYPNRVFEGVVAEDQPRLNATMNQSIVTYTVVVDTGNPDGKLLPYLTADLEFQVDKHSDVLMVPNAALRWRPSPERLAKSGLDPDTAIAKSDDGVGEGTGQVWVEENGRIRPVKVQEVLTDGTHTEVTGDGLTPGMQVVVAETYDAGVANTTNPFQLQQWSNTRKAP
jgi:HlyD family secretion protein